ncbi:DNA primase [Flexivirga endophytica]|uniref:DNA primase n=1 Tax=Flexivirga endophytica TaxID=1849103 RepID=A0A916WZD2_9MICO|nr:DNA primase [Flexivirga endophytica]GGB41370.1 DNA primase [Flexivirga endophytica]GHB49209.1 DNA primase [Flexivirga endophytica]
MAGRIKSEDVELVKERSSIEDVVSEHVTLRRSGSNLVGLCPFHDEKTPSFSVNPTQGFYHCFGCQKGGDVISFVQEVDHLSFAEAVERLAGKVGVELHYEDGVRPREESIGRRTRLLEAHRVAAEYYASLLPSMPEARTARDYLRGRDFDGEIAEQFGLGYAPTDGHALANLLRDKGFNRDELLAAGLVNRGGYDVFQGRLLWPIHDITGDTVGFGARRIFDNDPRPAKYLNTGETAIYKKQRVLYGLDLAKKSIADDRKAVIVEGYTDVMAAHLSGVTQAVATCGTAFGVEHIKLLRRLLRDERGGDPAKVVFTFDGDSAGQKAALKAYDEDQRWASQAYVAVAPDGQDPCELRIADGPEAVRKLVDEATPMFEFVVRTTLERFDLDSVGGRVAATRALAPIVADIRDPLSRDELIREVSRHIGVHVDDFTQAVRRAPRGGIAEAAQKTRDRQAEAPPEAAAAAPAYQPPNLRDPIVRADHMLLQCLVQFPGAMPTKQLEPVDPGDLTAPGHRAVFEAVREVGIDPTRSQGAWVSAINEAVPEAVRPLVARLAVESLPTKLDSQGRPDWHYIRSLVIGIRGRALRRRIDELMSARLRTEDPEQGRAISAELMSQQRALANLSASVE